MGVFRFQSFSRSELYRTFISYGGATAVLAGVGLLGGLLVVGILKSFYGGTATLSPEGWLRLEANEKALSTILRLVLLAVVVIGLVLARLVWVRVNRSLRSRISRRVRAFGTLGAPVTTQRSGVTILSPAVAVGVVLIGVSGAGTSTLARVLRVIEPTGVTIRGVS